MTAEQEIELTVNWPEAGLPPDEEQEEEIKEWMEDSFLRRLFYVGVVTSSFLTIVFTALVTLAGFITLYLVTPGLPTDPNAMFLIAVLVAIGVMGIDEILGHVSKPPIRMASSYGMYLVMIGIASLYFWYRHIQTARPFLTQAEFEEWMISPPILSILHQRRRGKGGSDENGGLFGLI